MSLIEIKNLTLERPLKVEEGPRPVEMLTSVKVTRKDESKIAAEVSSYVCSDASTGKVDRTCFGSISVSLGSTNDDVPPPRVDPLATTVPPVDVERFYSSVKETRLEYGDLFKRLDSMRRVDGIATATASWFADEIEYGNLYHPALIDVALQPVSSGPFCNSNKRSVMLYSHKSGVCCLQRPNCRKTMDCIPNSKLRKDHSQPKTSPRLIIWWSNRSSHRCLLHRTVSNQDQWRCQHLLAPRRLQDAVPPTRRNGAGSSRTARRLQRPHHLRRDQVGS